MLLWTVAGAFDGGPPSFFAGTLVVAEVGDEIGGPLDAFEGGAAGAGSFDGAFVVEIPLAGAWVWGVVPDVCLAGREEGALAVGGGPPINFFAGADGRRDFLAGTFRGGVPGARLGFLEVGACAVLLIGALAGNLGRAEGGEPVGTLAAGVTDCLTGNLLGALPMTFEGAASFLDGGTPATNGEDCFTPPLVGGEGSFFAPVGVGFFKLKIRNSLCLEVYFLSLGYSLGSDPASGKIPQY
jgi:hypothetical protein